MKRKSTAVAAIVGIAFLTFVKLWIAGDSESPRTKVRLPKLREDEIKAMLDSSSMIFTNSKGGTHTQEVVRIP